MRVLQKTLNNFFRPDSASHKRVRERDSQRSKLYAAERDAKLEGERFTSVSDMERYVKRKFPRATLVSRYGSYPSDLRAALASGRFTIKDGRGARYARGSAAYVKMPAWSRNEWILLHELAHTIHKRLPSGHPQHGGAGHGWQYAAVYYDVVRFILGKPAGDRLKEQFKLHRVKMKPKRAGRVADEATCARLALARAKRK